MKLQPGAESSDATGMTRPVIRDAMMRMKDVVVGDVVSRTPHEREGWFQVGVISRMFDGKLQVTDVAGDLAVSGSDFDLIGVQVITELEIVVAASSGFGDGNRDDADADAEHEAETETAAPESASHAPSTAPERPSILAGSKPAESSEPAPPPAPPASLAPPAGLTAAPPAPPAPLAPPAALFAERRPTG